MHGSRRRRISSVPLLTPKEFLLPRTPPPAPLLGTDVSFWHSGRPAIYQALRSLGIGTGQRVLVPAYACGSEVDALLKAGVIVEFYRIRPDMTIDLEHLESLCEPPPAALYITHYFGFSQPIDALQSVARRHGARLIEDCAQALYSADGAGRSLGTTGDAGIFSLSKTLPVTDGGALLMSRPGRDVHRPAPSRPPSLRAVLGPLKHQAEELGLRHARTFTGGLKRVMDPVLRLTKRRGAPRASLAVGDDHDPEYRAAVMDHIELKPERTDWGISPVGRFLFDRTPHRQVAERRRRNYETLARELPDVKGVRWLYPKLPPYCCPLFFPLLVEEPRDLHRFLSGRGIDTKRIWSYFHDRMLDIPFPFETKLKTHVIALPIHHQLDEEDMATIAEAIREWGACGPGRSARG
jgi:dTDP-4-amino-4,6-dideoxygalactose transaminase